MRRGLRRWSSAGGSNFLGEGGVNLIGGAAARVVGCLSKYGLTDDLCVDFAVRRLWALF